jgi:transposase
MKNQNIIGVDVSRDTLDLFFRIDSSHLRITNDSKGFMVFIKQLNKLHVSKEDCMLVMEHTGIYSYPFEIFLAKHSIPFAKVSALEIKRSSGIVRGKNDKADSNMIAESGYKSEEKIKTAIPSTRMNYIKSLLSLRDRFVRQRAGYIASLKEQSDFLEIKKSSPFFKSQNKIIDVFTKEIAKIDLELKKIIEQEKDLDKTFRLLTSVIGVGPIVASYMIVYTNNFTLFPNARKFASYCGVAPFDNSSGKSIKPSKISELANKNIKRLLDLSARSAINFDPEIHAFYERRTKAGKNKRSTRNIIRNKILGRMFAVVKREGVFQKNYQQVA